jgi:hypothetical protein
MDEKEWRGGIKQKRVAAENRIDRVNPLFACFLSLSIIFSPVSLYFILFYSFGGWERIRKEWKQRIQLGIIYGQMR